MQVLAVEADDERVVVVGGFDGVFGLAGVGGGAGELELVLLEADLDGAGALVGELRYALDGAHEVFAADDDELVVVAGQDGLVVGELAGELAAGEDAAADAEEEGLVVVGELEGLGVGVGEQARELASALRGMRVFFSPETPSRVSPGFSMWARRWPSVATMAMDSALRTSRAPLRV